MRSNGPLPQVLYDFFFWHGEYKNVVYFTLLHLFQVDSARVQVNDVDSRWMHLIDYKCCYITWTPPGVQVECIKVDLEQFKRLRALKKNSVHMNSGKLNIFKNKQVVFFILIYY